VSKAADTEAKLRPITFADLVHLEPRLGDLMSEATARWQPRRRSNDLLDVWYRYFRPKLLRLVGGRRMPHPVLSTPQAYQLAYDTLLASLKSGVPTT